MQSEITQIQSLIDQSKVILITAPSEASYDEVATGLAWLQWLRAKSKQAELILEHTQLSVFSWLPQAKEIQPAGQYEHKHFVIRIKTDNFKLGEFRYEVGDKYLDIMLGTKSGTITPADISPLKADFPFDLVITLGVAERSSLGQLATEYREQLQKVPTINIDRRPDNTNFGQINLVNITATSLAEICYELFKPNLDAQLAQYLLTSMISSTRSFQTPQVSPETLRLASELMIAGAKRDEIVLNLYRNKNLATLKVWGQILARLKQEDGIVYSFISRDEVADATLDWWGLCQELILTSPQAKIAVLLYQEEFEKTTVHSVARENFDLTILLSRYQPKGTKRQVEFSIDQALPTIEKEVLALLAEKMKTIAS
jgi:hypothetical protein